MHNIDDNAIVETGTSDIYLSPRAPCINIIYTVTPVRVDTSSGRTQKSTATGTLQREELPVRVGHIMINFAHSLLGDSKLCDAGCEVIFDKNNFIIYGTTNNTIITGRRDKTGANLWWISLLLSETPLLT